MYAALQGAATLADVVDIGHHAADLRRRAEALKDRFNEVFWDRRGWFVLGLDADGRPIDSLTTNPGHALWSGIADERQGRAGTSSGSSTRTSGPAGGCAPWRVRWPPTTR